MVVVIKGKSLILTHVIVLDNAWQSLDFFEHDTKFIVLQFGTPSLLDQETQRTELPYQEKREGNSRKFVREIHISTASKPHGRGMYIVLGTASIKIE